MDTVDPTDLAVQHAAAVLARGQKGLADKSKLSTGARAWATAAAERAERLAARGSDWPMGEHSPMSLCRRCGERVTSQQEHVIDGGVHYHNYCFDRMLDERRQQAGTPRDSSWSA